MSERRVSVFCYSAADIDVVCVHPPRVPWAETNCIILHEKCHYGGPNDDVAVRIRPVQTFAEYTVATPSDAGDNGWDYRWRDGVVGFLEPLKYHARLHNVPLGRYVNCPACRDAGLTVHDMLCMAQRWWADGYEVVYLDNAECGAKGPSGVGETMALLIGLHRLGFRIFHHASIHPHGGGNQPYWSALDLTGTDWLLWGESTSVTRPEQLAWMSRYPGSHPMPFWKPTDQWLNQYPDRAARKLALKPFVEYQARNGMGWRWRPGEMEELYREIWVPAEAGKA